ncbi:Shedu anti-phage system protein SduA domain-containing protein [Streptomyces sp. NPDC057592]|uniref:Shedu anti-phage system protein SduA domain-containing protein n=1 Tax=unclassified Streptomyces TaxID=2593676 RepID=UPI0036A1990C
MDDDWTEADEYIKQASEELIRNGHRKICSIRDHPTASAVDEFKKVLEEAKDEKPLQEFFEQRPEVLAQQLGAGCRWIVPRPNMGGVYIPDFMAARVDSGGFRWVAVELESPCVDSLFTKTHGTEAKELRKGLQQIKDWRNWLENNLQTARNSPRFGGCGFVDITPRVQGLVIVGRRRITTPDDDQRRRDIWWNEHSEVHTYDWLYEEARKLVPLHRPSSDECEECQLYGR